MSNSIFIISDVHGCYKTLLALMQQLPKNANICFVGDLIDRGTHSKEVIDFVMSNNYDCVLGNHEVAFIDTVLSLLQNKNNWSEQYKWFKSTGGKETLKSYGINSFNDITTDKLNDITVHLNYLKSLPLYKEYTELKTATGRYPVVSHSHVFNNWEYRNYDKNSNEYKAFKKCSTSSRFKNFDNQNIFNIYGHTPLEKPIIEEHRACIDLGCVFDNGTNLKGYLCALEFPSLNIFKQENIEQI